MTDANIPDVKSTDLTRDEMEQVAAECGIDPDGLEDQELLERLGAALGELDAQQAAADGGRRGAGAGEAGRRGRKRTRVDRLRGRLASLLDRAADKVRPTGGGQQDSASRDAGTHGEDQSRPRAAARTARRAAGRARRRFSRRRPPRT